MARRKNNSDDDAVNPSFEDALTGLESIVEAMEHEQLPLEELVSHYEQGCALLNRCESILQSARERIELITLRNQNEIVPDSTARKEEADETLTLHDTPDDSDDDNDIRLF